MDKFPEIETNRLLLRKLSFEDIPKIIEYAGNKKVAEATLNIPHPYKEEDAIFWLNSANTGFKKKIQYTFAIRTKINNEFIGGIGLKININFKRGVLGYWIAEPFWNKGFATESVGGILKFGFNKIKLNKIYATHFFENPASGRVMIKNGMIKEGELKDHTKKGDLLKSLIQYRLTNKEFENKNQT